MNSRPDLATLFMDTLTLSLAANAVIAVRLSKMAFGVVDPSREAPLMVLEKVDAAIEASLAARGDVEPRASCREG